MLQSSKTGACFHLDIEINTCHNNLNSLLPAEFFNGIIFREESRAGAISQNHKRNRKEMSESWDREKTLRIILWARTITQTPRIEAYSYQMTS